MKVKILTHLSRFLAAVVFIHDQQVPIIYIPLGVMALLFGVVEALFGYWKEVGARVIYRSNV